MQEYHAQIMALQAGVSDGRGEQGQGEGSEQYEKGFASARILAAEIAAQADETIDDLAQALEKAVQYVPMQVTACNGLKCQEPHCESCNGEEVAQEAVREAEVELEGFRNVLAKVWERIS